MCAMGPALVVELPPACDEHLGFGTAAENHSRFGNLSHCLPLKLSTKPFCHRLPSVMKAGPIDASRNPRMMRAAVNSAPSSDRMNAGLPYRRGWQAREYAGFACTSRYVTFYGWLISTTGIACDSKSANWRRKWD